MSSHIRPVPQGHDHLIPHLCCERCSEAIEFYKKAFGAEEIHRMPEADGRRIMHAALRIGQDLLYLNDDFPEYCEGKTNTPTALGGTSVSIHRYVENCDAAIKRAEEAGATVQMPAQDMFWGDRYGVIIDPFGHKWAFATRLKEMTTEQMQEASRKAFA